MTEAARADLTVCARTGLALAPAGGERAWRVSRTAYGPLRPLRRPSNGGDPHDWGRFDTPGGRTVYCAFSREGAYAEVLASFKRSLSGSDPLANAAAELDDVAPTQLVSLIEDEWVARGHMILGHLPRGWREARAIYQLTLPRRGWWVVLEHPESLAAAEATLGPRLAACGVESLTVATLRGNARDITTLLARWVRSLVLEDGAQAHGIRFESKYATGTCWAYWLRRFDEGQPISSEPVAADGGTAIADTDVDLQTVASRFGLRIW